MSRPLMDRIPPTPGKAHRPEPELTRQLSPTEREWKQRIYDRLLKVLDLSLLGALEEGAARHQKRSTVTLEDIQRTLARDSVAVVPNHFKSVLSSIDGGVPILEFEPSSAVARSIVDLQRTICGVPPAERASLLRRALPIFSGKE